LINIGPLTCTDVVELRETVFNRVKMGSSKELAIALIPDKYLESDKKK